VAMFVGLRYFNRFGDPHPWQVQDDRELHLFFTGRGWIDVPFDQSGLVLTAFSFLNCTKYPPSLLFLLMTLGPAITALALFDRPMGWLGKPFVVFGRVPLFYYLLHLPLIHGVAVAVDYYRFGWSPIAGDSIWTIKPEQFPAD